MIEWLLLGLILFLILGPIIKILLLWKVMLDNNEQEMCDNEKNDSLNNSNPLH